MDLIALKQTTRAIINKNTLETIFTNDEVPLNRLASIPTEEALAMLGSKAGLMKNNDINNFSAVLPVRCIIHREHLTGRYFKYEEIIKTILEIVNFIDKNAKIHWYE